jgi:proteic killer suppression protein
LPLSANAQSRKKQHSTISHCAVLFLDYNLTTMIKSFADAETGKVFNLTPSRKLPGKIQTRAKVKLDQLNAASELNHLRVPPSNRLEALKGKRAGQHSIRINDQWRLCFRWVGGNAHEVEITDYH